MFRLLINLSWMLLVAPAAMGWQLEVGEETLNFNNYNNVTFQQAFPLGVTPVVVALTPGDRADPNDEPAVVRIRNVTNTGFEMAIVEPPGSDGRYVTQNETVQYLAVEPGVHEFPNGDIIEAATISTAAVQHGSGVPGAESWVTQPLAGGFPTPPVIVGMPQTTNNEQNPNAPGNNQQSFPFVTMAIRNVNAGNFQLANERSEVNDQPLFFIFQAETLGYIAMENGAGGTFLDNVANTIAYESFRSGDNVRGWDNGCYARPTANFLNTYNATPAAFG
ncbi:MAG: hypothetical protein OXT49_10430, partial [Gammaproteobacteria bacterium]|nr:hypothetical protein [Gammaproteobacteria bacterium]